MKIKNLFEQYKNNGKSFLDKESFLVYYFFRPLSLIITPFFLKLKITPNQVTYLCTFIGFCGAILFCFGEKYFFVAFLLILFAQLLDHVDGNIARFNNSNSYYGKFIDGLSDSFWLTLAIIGIGVGLFVSKRSIEVFDIYNKSIFLIISLIICFMKLFYSFAEAKYLALKNELLLKFSNNKNDNFQNVVKKLNVTKIVKYFFKIKTDVYFLLMFFAVIFQKLELFVLVILIYELFSFAMIIIKLLIKGKRELSFYREI